MNIERDLNIESGFTRKALTKDDTVPLKVLYRNSDQASLFNQMSRVAETTPFQLKLNIERQASLFKPQLNPISKDRWMPKASETTSFHLKLNIERQASLFMSRHISISKEAIPKEVLLLQDKTSETATNFLILNTEGLYFRLATSLFKLRFSYLSSSSPIPTESRDSRKVLSKSSARIIYSKTAQQDSGFNGDWVKPAHGWIIHGKIHWITFNKIREFRRLRHVSLSRLEHTQQRTFRTYK